jgi:hypothetical protein
MSDYGSTLTITKKNLERFNESERQALSDEMGKLIDSLDLTDAVGSKFLNELFIYTGDSEDPPCVFGRLSEHFYGNNGDENKEGFDFVEEMEMDEIEDLIKALTKVFPTYDFKRSIQEW